MKVSTIFITFAMVFVSGIAAAAPATELKVAGTVKPGACIPTIANAGYVDYGMIQVSSLKSRQYTALPARETTLTIECDMPIRMAIKTSDNRSSSASPEMAYAVEPDALNPPPGSIGLAMYGLGMQGANAIGSYYLALRPHTLIVDGEPATLNFTHQLGVRQHTTGEAGNMYKNAYMTVARTVNGAPIAFKSFSGRLRVSPVLNTKEALSTVEEINLDGLMTLELVYL